MDMILLFAIQLCTMLYCILKKQTKLWFGQFAFQAICTAYAGAMWYYYDTLPAPEGLKAPGLYMLTETLIYFAATAVFACLLVVTLFITVLRLVTGRNEN